MQRFDVCNGDADGLCAVLQWRRRGALLVVGLWAVLATITAATAFGSTRYRTAAEVSVVVLAAVAIDAGVRLWRREPVIERRAAAGADADPGDLGDPAARVVPAG